MQEDDYKEAYLSLQQQVVVLKEEIEKQKVNLRTIVVVCIKFCIAFDDLKFL